MALIEQVGKDQPMTDRNLLQSDVIKAIEATDTHGLRLSFIADAIAAIKALPDGLDVATLSARIVELEADNERLRVALRPFVDKANKAMVGYTDDWSTRMGRDYPVFGWNGAIFLLGDFLDAQAALNT